MMGKESSTNSTDEKIFREPFDFMADYPLYAIAGPTGGSHRGEWVN